MPALHGVDCEAIGAGLYDLMNKDHRTLVAFGMIPKDVIDKAMGMIRARIGEVAAEKYEGVPADHLAACVKPEFLREVEHRVCLAIHARAAELGKMVV